MKANSSALSLTTMLLLCFLFCNTTTYAKDTARLINSDMQQAIDIFSAVRTNNIADIKQFIRNKGTLNIKNERGYTPFIIATYYNHLESAKLLLAAGANPCAVDKRGSNAFMGVAFKGHDDIARWLLETSNCDINQQNNAGQTALMMAALFDNENIVKLFLKHQADPNIIDHQGNTASSLAKNQGLAHILDIIKFNIQ